MDNQGLLNKISFIIQDLKSQHARLSGNVTRFTGSEVDLFLTNARYLIEHLELLKKHAVDNTSAPALHKISNQDRLQNGLVVEDSKGKNPVSKLPDQSAMPPQAREFPQAKKEKTQPNQFPLQNKQGVFGPLLERRAAQLSAKSAEEGAEALRLSSENPGIVGSLLNMGAPESNINELLARRGESLNSKLDKVPMREIRKAIALNDHLLFIRTLFGGDPSAYDKTLSILDNMPDLKSAEEYLDNEVAVKFKWSAGHQAVPLFKAIITRRFNGG